MMPNWICCNSCFHPPAADFRLAVTTCGHIVCQGCFQKGKEGGCLICKAQCQVSALSDKSSADVKALFSEVNILADKYFSEISKVLVFQMRHQRRLLSHYRQKNVKLEEYIKKMKEEMQLMNKKLEEQNAYIDKFDTALQQQRARTVLQSSQLAPSLYGSMTTPQLKQIPFASPMGRSQPSSSSSLVEQMEVDTQGLYKQPEISGSITRLSLLSPPLDGQMGTVPHRSVSQSSLLTHFTRSATVRRNMSWETPSFKPPLPVCHASLSALPSIATNAGPLSFQGHLPR
ncbi:probable E3 SUMO-protein ligase RNF212 [Megalops cyprinoides]|uniref:probable E3 SUMO-protein ligase RNF212 n=1 Tax=Megalops cyprinoides TaxID=118141 RepID=UPI001864E868|nr:probable E3 SUMO-protein ligase RNF212 [Megalops cyprinoides]